jgi:hypothetical protein
MASSNGGQGRRAKDAARAAAMKAQGIVRTTGRCEGCLRIVTCNSSKSRFTHMCGAGRKGL